MVNQFMMIKHDSEINMIIKDGTPVFEGYMDWIWEKLYKKLVISKEVN